MRTAIGIPAGRSKDNPFHQSTDISATGELFSADRLKQLIANHASATPSELLNTILAAVRAFADNRPLQDDLTLLVASPCEA